VRTLRIVAADDFPTIAFESQSAWEAWLREHHESADGVWMKRAKKASGIASLDWAEAVEVALCYGWIDGQAKGLDDTWYLQKFTPRRKRSMWSKVNVDKATALIDAGRMQPAGLREVERAKADGRWDAAYHPPSANRVPEELQRELDRDPVAAAAWEELDRQNRYAMQHRVATAKKPETRVRRAEKFAAMLRAGEKLYP
jgi:uncharacterized protein YdeI (YjbR/CyaY-like superfamily)